MARIFFLKITLSKSSSNILVGELTWLWLTLAGKNCERDGNSGNFEWKQSYPLGICYIKIRES